MDSILNFVTGLPPFAIFLFTLMGIAFSFNLHDGQHRWRKPQSRKDYIGYSLAFTVIVAGFIMLIA